MSVNKKDIQWGSYREYEGPWYRGKIKFLPPKNPDFLDNVMWIITSTEGGCYDAINMYDRMILTVGIIQWGESGQRSVSKLLGAVVDSCGYSAIAPVSEVAMKHGYEFAKWPDGTWGFVSSEDEDRIDSPLKMRELYLGCAGTKGSWDDDSRDRAKEWAAAFAQVWESPCAQKVQVEYTKKRINGFVMPSSRQLLFDDAKGPWVDATRAVFLSYAANLPAVADRQAVASAAALKDSGFEKWSREWCVRFVKRLVSNSGIDIWPARWKKVCLAVNSTFKVDFPVDVINYAAEEKKDVPVVVAPVVVPDAHEPAPVPPIVIPVVNDDKPVPWPAPNESFWSKLWNLFLRVFGFRTL